MYWIYNLFVLLLSPLWLSVMFWRSKKRSPAPNWKERQGVYQVKIDKCRPRVWVHAVSVGEVMAAIPVLRELKSKKPELAIFLTTTTSSGQQTAVEKVLNEGLVDQVAYFPIDIATFQLSAIAAVRPQAVVIMETELWFNFLWASKVLRSETLLINGRISPRSFARSKYLKFFYRAMLKNLDLAMMQSAQDQERIEQLGATNAIAVGNTKFDEWSAVSPLTQSEARQKLGIGPSEFVIVVGSTRGEEEQTMVADALAQLTNEHGIKIVHAPRHLETANALRDQYASHAIKAEFRTSGQAGEVIVLDTYGELSWVYAAADIAVIGGGFSNNGGQNLFQALALGVPVIRGPHFGNFEPYVSMPECTAACAVVTEPPELIHTILALRSDVARRQSMGEAGQKFIESQKGAASTFADEILRRVDQSQVISGEKR